MPMAKLSPIQANITKHILELVLYKTKTNIVVNKSTWPDTNILDGNKSIWLDTNILDGNKSIRLDINIPD